MLMPPPTPPANAIRQRGSVISPCVQFSLLQALTSHAGKKAPAQGFSDFEQHGRGLSLVQRVWSSSSF